MNDFEEGDIVYLKSGGPAITITEVGDGDSVWCTWFCKNNELQGQAFTKASLTRSKPDKPVVV
ncbi:YodC family protein [Acinetobacter sp. TY2]|uniref:YodC family protein n=1 Tax=Acinetobacter sp. TY2 TaxID=3387403 RepID=UPI0039176CDA